MASIFDVFKDVYEFVNPAAKERRLKAERELREAEERKALQREADTRAEMAAFVLKTNDKARADALSVKMGEIKRSVHGVVKAFVKGTTFEWMPYSDPRLEPSKKEKPFEEPLHFSEEDTRAMIKEIAQKDPVDIQSGLAALVGGSYRRDYEGYLTRDKMLKLTEMLLENGADPNKDGLRRDVVRTSGDYHHKTMFEDAVFYGSGNAAGFIGSDALAAARLMMQSPQFDLSKQNPTVVYHALLAIEPNSDLDEEKKALAKDLLRMGFGCQNAVGADKFVPNFYVSQSEVAEKLSALFDEVKKEKAGMSLKDRLAVFNKKGFRSPTADRKKTEIARKKALNNKNGR